MRSRSHRPSLLLPSLLSSGLPSASSPGSSPCMCPSSSQSLPIKADGHAACAEALLASTAR
jgi:hypothetical protein